MDATALVQHSRRDGGGTGIGLGWLLVIALGGGILVFAAVGLLLAWRLKARAAPCTTRVYAADGDPAPSSLWHPGSSTTRLMKRQQRFQSGDLSSSRFSSRLSISLPPVPILPPLPTYSSVKGAIGAVVSRGRSRSWVDEDALHGPKMGARARGSWFLSESSGFDGRAPTLPSVEAAEKGEAAVGVSSVEVVEESVAAEEGVVAASAGASSSPSSPGKGEGNTLDVKKRRSNPALQGSKTAPMLAADDDDDESDDPPRGRVRVAAQTHVRCSATDTDLRDILRSTEQRLRDGSSQSPVKTPRTSPSKNGGRTGSPTKTPKSCRSGSSQGSSFRTARSTRATPSPTKRGGQASTPTQQHGRTPKAVAHARNASATSVASVANSLIREATQELELPDGSSSPSRMRGGKEDWKKKGSASPQVSPQQQRRLEEQQRQQQQQHYMHVQQQIQQQKQQQQQQSHHRKYSLESTASSSLSTLYSVSEPDDVKSERTSVSDPFIEDSRTMPRILSFQAKKHHNNNNSNNNSHSRVAGPRPLTKFGRQKSAGSLPKSGSVDNNNASNVPAPLRPMSSNKQIGLKRDDSKGSRLSLVLRPPMTQQSEEVGPKSAEPTPRDLDTASLPSASSESSMVTDTVHSESDLSEGGEGSATPKAEWSSSSPRRHGETGSLPPMTPTRGDNDSGRDARSDVSSSPYEEHEILAALLTGSGPRRALPAPPGRVTTAADGSVVATPLSPPPRNSDRKKKQQQQQQVQQSPTMQRRMSASSSSSSIYDDESTICATSNCSPSRRSTVRSTRSNNNNSHDNEDRTVGSTIAELRRMNSMVSSYSVASIASTMAGGDGCDSSPSIPNLANGFLAASRSGNKSGSISSKHYFNMGGGGSGSGQTSPHKGHGRKKSVRSQAGVQRSRSRTATIHEAAEKPTASKALPDKENEGLGLRMPRIDVTAASPAGLRESRRGSVNLGGRESPTPIAGPPTTATTTTSTAAATVERRNGDVVVAARRGPVDDLIAQERRQANRSHRESVESLGLYDKDGFLIGSPDRETKGRCLRM